MIIFKNCKENDEMKLGGTKGSSCCSVNRPVFLPKMEGNKIGLSQSLKKEVKFQEKLIYIPGGEFLMGTEDKVGFPSDGEGPIRKVRVGSFYMDSHTVTNADFNEFIKETGYQTEAEQYGWSFVFCQFILPQLASQMQQVPGTPWWLVVPGANWYQPEGPGSDLKHRMDHPVIHVSWNDAKAFCDWAGKRLPTEQEWEYAARGGLEQKKYPWGDELMPNGEHYCNIWQGEFPRINTREDNYLGTAPVQSYHPNGFGLYQVVGNVWEWCSDWFSTNPSRILNPSHIHSQTPKVMRGGSFLCHESYCNRYRVAARSSNTIDSSTSNIGFRCVASVK
jgi:formylglycine-generating enzyme required for sulfatase activity